MIVLIKLMMIIDDYVDIVVVMRDDNDNNRLFYDLTYKLCLYDSFLSERI